MSRGASSRSWEVDAAAAGAPAALEAAGIGAVPQDPEADPDAPPGLVGDSAGPGVAEAGVGAAHATRAGSATTADLWIRRGLDNSLDVRGPELGWVALLVEELILDPATAEGD